MHRTSIFITLLLFASPVWGLTITVPAETAEHNLVAFTCDSPQAGCRWVVKGPRGDEALYLAGTGGVFTGPPGAYVVLLKTATEKTWAETTITEDENRPDPPPPNPEPDPKPDPDPSPVPGIKQVTVIYEKDDLKGKSGAKQAAVLANLTWRNWVKDQGHSLSVLDQNVKLADGTPSPTVAELLPHVKGKLPVLFSVSEDGSFQQMPLPKSAQGIIDFIEKWGG